MFTLSFILETLAVVSALLYVLLASKQNYLCWPMSIFSCVIYAWLCFDVKLYLETALQIFYFFVALFGWYNWKKINTHLTPSYLPMRHNLYAFLILFTSGMLLGFLVSNYTNAALPYIDSCIFFFSVYATYITATKKIDSWIYWIIIDAISIFIYINRGLNITATLYFIYCILAIIGLKDWSNAWKNRTLKA